ncbi:hypothetical protein HDU91_000097 [Kappamyces sp. JEL0680]|nr:hypothetical protein HDU91_000097 [Kappamyces sp. JEL0680]
MNEGKQPVVYQSVGANPQQPYATTPGQVYPFQDGQVVPGAAPAEYYPAMPPPAQDFVLCQLCNQMQVPEIQHLTRPTKRGNVVGTCWAFICPCFILMPCCGVEYEEIVPPLQNPHLIYTHHANLLFLELSMLLSPIRDDSGRDLVEEAPFLAPSGTSIWRLDSLSSCRQVSNSIDIPCLHGMPGEMASTSMKNCFLVDHHDSKKSEWEERTPTGTPRATREAIEARLCNNCATNKTTKWYKDHEDFGKHICKRCYNQRYKERIKG